jgi:hypothetical protein
VNGWWWLLYGLAAWLAVSLAAALVAGPALARVRRRNPVAPPEPDEGFGGYDEGAAERAARIVERNGWRRHP